MHRTPATPLLEPLEPRRHLAADLAVSWDPVFHPQPTTLAPGESVQGSVNVVNLSAQAQISGRGRFEYFLSTDRTLDDHDIALPASSAYMTFSGHAIFDLIGGGVVPPSTPDGQYYLIVRLTPNATFADPDLSNNIAVTTDPITVQQRHADLSVYWDTAHFQLPSVLVPGETLHTPLQVANLTGQPNFFGDARFDYYLSPDTTLDAGDVPIRSVTASPLDFVGTAPRTFHDDPLIPTDITPGSYYLIAKVTPTAHFDDPDLSNNVAVTPTPLTIVRRFGDFSGRTHVTAVIRGPDGHDVVFGQPEGSGYGEVAVGPNGFNLTYAGNFSSVISRSWIRPVDYASATPTPFDFASITLSGSLQSLDAPQGRLRGPLSTTGPLQQVSLGDVLGPLTITIPDVSPSPTFILGNVREASINSASGIAIDAKSWLDLDGVPDTIRATGIGSLTIHGNFYPSLSLSGAPQGYYTLGPTTISGVVKAGAWAVHGSASPIHIYSSTVNWSASFAGTVSSLTTDASFRGTFTAHSIGSITSGRDLLYGRILAGAFLGDDARFGGAGPDADTYAQGSIGAITVAHNVAGCWIGAGWNPVDGVFNNGDDRIEGASNASIGRIAIGHVAGIQSRFIANFYGTTFPSPGDTISIGGVHVDWRHDSRFTLAPHG